MENEDEPFAAYARGIKGGASTLLQRKDTLRSWALRVGVEPEEFIVSKRRGGMNILFITARGREVLGNKEVYQAECERLQSLLPTKDWISGEDISAKTGVSTNALPRIKAAIANVLGGDFAEQYIADYSKLNEGKNYNPEFVSVVQGIADTRDKLNADGIRASYELAVLAWAKENGISPKGRSATFVEEELGRKRESAQQRKGRE